MKLLALCDSPTVSTGFGTVAAQLLPRWAKAGFEIDCWAINFTGWGYRRAPFCELLPAGSNWTARLDLFLKRLEDGGYTHCWLFQDHFQFSPEFAARFQEICARKQIRSLFYTPVDSDYLHPDWTALLQAVDVPVAYTEHGRACIAAASRPKDSPSGGTPEARSSMVWCDIVPHGVDGTVFKPLPAEKRATLRAGLWKPAWVAPDDFLLLNVNTNTRRKDPARSLEILAGLRARGIPAKLIMHMPDLCVDEQVRLSEIAPQLGLEHGKHWGHHDMLFRNRHALLSTPELNKIYNVADCLLSTSLGEGWGLSITEALAAGLPVAIPDHTAPAEIARRLAELHPGRTVLLPCTDRVVLSFDHSRFRPRVNVDLAVAQIASAYELGLHRSRPGLSPAAAAWLDWDRIAARWLELFAGNSSSHNKT